MHLGRLKVSVENVTSTSSSFTLQARHAQLTERSAIMEQLQQELAAAKEENDSLRAGMNDVRCIRPS